MRYTVLRLGQASQKSPRRGEILCPRMVCILLACKESAFEFPERSSLPFYVPVDHQKGNPCKVTVGNTGFKEVCPVGGTILWEHHDPLRGKSHKITECGFWSTEGALPWFWLNSSAPGIVGEVATRRQGKEPGTPGVRAMLSRYVSYLIWMENITELKKTPRV